MTAGATSIQTRITSLFGCRYPIILPGMSWISDPTLVAAVSNAGGVGILASGPLNAKETREAIHKIRSTTDQPFGIGCTLLMPGARENAQVALEERVPIINISLGKGDWIAEQAHDYGGKILATVTNAKHAQSAIESGADALMLTGHEAAAHGGDVTSLVLVPSIAKRFPHVPLVAAGGFADGRGLAAAICLGADAVAMGSRFAVTKESSLAQRMKEIVSDDNLDGGGTESDTVYGKNFDGIPARVLKSEKSLCLNAKPAPLPVVIYRAFNAARKMNIPLHKVIPGLLTQWDKMYIVAQFGAATDSLMKATIDGDFEKGVQFIGQSQGLINDIPSVDELTQRIINEAIETSSHGCQTFAGMR
ncbi:hypothetical protein ACHAW6_013556 [Cyclotella cf. meneghiniana]